VLSPHEDLLRALVAETPDMTLAEIRDQLRQQRSISVCLATIHVSLRRSGCGFQKKDAEGGRAGPCDVAERRHRLAVYQRYMDAVRFSFSMRTRLTTR